MKLLFLGTPDYAVPSLRRLAAEHEVVGVVAQPDRPVGRRGAAEPPPVARLARELGLRLFQPEKPGRRAFAAELGALGAELSVVIAYGHILRPALIDLAPMGMINAHGSLLPRYRGAAPIQRAVLAGEAETGVTVQRVVLEVDAGAVLLQERLAIGPEETSGELFARMAGLSAEALSRGVRLVESGRAVFLPQDPAAVTFAPKLTKEEGQADWSRPAAHLARAARAYNPWPTLHTKLPDGRGLKILRAREEPGAVPAGLEPGAVAAASGADFLVACGAGLLRLTEVQAEGKRPMSAGEFLRGARLAPGAGLG
ncbi:MAG TPA: methionyl-tRNA formyltransferase [Planctomycetota bacterium]|nr:methionyl-tRNA formyltransferase [Planctomycetota bacterium]